MKKFFITIMILVLSLSMAGCSQSLFFGNDKMISSDCVDEPMTSEESKGSSASEIVSETEKAEKYENTGLPEDEFFESQVTKEGMVETVRKVRHYTNMGFSLEYPEEFERYNSDDSILIKWYDSSLVIKMYPQRDMESVKKELIGDRLNITEDIVELSGKKVPRAYSMSNDVEAFYFIENDDALYVATTNFSLEGLEGIGVDFYDMLKSKVGNILRPLH